MKTVVLIVSHVKKDDSFLFRKKPDGSPPYKETWYGFGAILDGDNTNPEEVIKNSVKKSTGVDTRLDKYLWWDTETKKDLDGETKFFVYLHSLSVYVSGNLTLSEGIEKLEWIPVDKLGDYAIVPPSRKFLDKYLKTDSWV